MTELETNFLVDNHCKNYSQIDQNGVMYCWVFSVLIITLLGSFYFFLIMSSFLDRLPTN